jgi:hypothetical protein
MQKNMRQRITRDEDPLRRLIRREIEAAREDVLAAGGDVSAEQVARLEQLSRLLQLSEAAQPLAPRRRWVLAAALVGTLVVVSVLLFARVAETEVELDLALEDAAFVLAVDQVMTDVINVSTLDAGDFRNIQLPVMPGDGAPGESAEAQAGDAIRIGVASHGNRTGIVSLMPLALAAESRVRIRHTGRPYGYRFSLEGDDLELQIGVQGPVEIGLAGAPLVAHDYATPRSIQLRSAVDPVDLDLIFPEALQPVFLPQLVVTGLTFSRIDEFADLERTLVRRISTIRSGTLYLEELNGRAVPLRAGEALRFDEVRGHMRILQLHENHITLQFRGRVRGMRTGWDEVRRSLMPTYLEWLKERHGLILLWGTTLYLFGIISGLLRWWGVRV